MTDQTLAARMAASLAAALGSRSATTEAAGKTTNIGERGKSYGKVLKVGNVFVAEAGVAGAASAKVDKPSKAVNLAPNAACRMPDQETADGLRQLSLGAGNQEAVK